MRDVGLSNLVKPPKEQGAETREEAMRSIAKMRMMERRSKPAKLARRCAPQVGSTSASPAANHRARSNAHAHGFFVPQPRPRPRESLAYSRSEANATQDDTRTSFLQPWLLSHHDATHDERGICGTFDTPSSLTLLPTSLPPDPKLLHTSSGASGRDSDSRLVCPRHTLRLPGKSSILAGVEVVQVRLQLSFHDDWSTILGISW